MWRHCSIHPHAAEELYWNISVLVYIHLRVRDSVFGWWWWILHNCITSRDVFDYSWTLNELYSLVQSLWIYITIIPFRSYWTLYISYYLCTTLFIFFILLIVSYKILLIFCRISLTFYSKFFILRFLARLRFRRPSWVCSQRWYTWVWSCHLLSEGSTTGIMAATTRSPVFSFASTP